MSQPQKSNSSRGRQCAVYGCNNFQLLQDGSKSDIHLFSVPQSILMDKRKRDRWCNLIKRQHGRDGFEMSKNTRICHHHFLREQIKVSLVNKIWTLKPGAEPCVFDWKRLQNVRKAPTQRAPLSPLSMKPNNFADPESQFEDENLPDFEKETVTCQYTQTDVITSEMGTQTSWDDIYPSHHADEHCYSSCKVDIASNDFSFNENLRSQIVKLEHDLEKAKSKISELQELIEYFEGNRFSIEKIKDDKDAMSFYTGFQNYGVFNAVFVYLQNKAARLQYWRGQNEQTDNKQYQTQGVNQVKEKTFIKRRVLHGRT